jgi:hypothetical protein
MSHFACPLCSKNSSIANYSPDELDLDLMVVTFGSHGRGGIYIEDKSSVLGEGDLSSMVAGRTLKLVKMFMDSGDLQVSQVLTELGIYAPSTDSTEVATLRANLGQVMSEASRFREDAVAAEFSLSKMEEERKRDEEVEKT